MPSSRFRDVVHNLNVLLRDGSAGGLDDGQLLSRFLVDGDESAFEILVERHGPVVLRVCRSILGPAEDPRDAFQATFLVLVKRAQSLLDHSSVGPWLVGVSYRIATRARIDAFRRSTYERTAAADRPTEHLPGPSSETWAELYQELGRLPDKYRDPLVLCYLEGRTAEQAAQSLGCPRGTVLSRMARARAQLKERLARRGVTTADSSLIAGLTASSVKAPLPPGLADATIETAIRLVGRAGLAGMGVLARWTAVAGVVLATVVVAFGLALAAKQGAKGPSPAPTVSSLPVARPKASIEPQQAGEMRTLIVEVRDLITDARLPDVEIATDVVGADGRRLILKAMTDGEGQARFQLVRPEGIRRLRANLAGQGFVPLLLDWERGESSPIPTKFLLQAEKATTIRGRVVDEKRSPAPRATVNVTVLKRYPKSTQRVAIENVTTTTDAEGRWSFDGVPESPETLRLSAVLDEGDRLSRSTPIDFLTASPFRSGEAALILWAHSRVHGTVVSPDGKPIAGATLRRLKTFDLDSIDAAIPTVVSDADGKFAVDLRQGHSEIATVHGAGYAPTMTRIRDTMTPQQLTIVLQPGKRLEGLVVGLDGKPIPNAAIEIRDRNGASSIKKTMHSGPSGTFAWEDAVAGEVQMRISADGYVERTLVGLAGASNRVVLTAPTTIRGAVLDDETGTPLPSYSLCSRTANWPGDVMIWQRYLNVNKQANRSDRGFDYTFSDGLLGPRFRYLVRVQAPGYTPADSGPFASGTSQDVTYRLKKAAPIRGVVTRADGSPAREGMVHIVLEHDPFEIDHGEVGLLPFDGITQSPIDVGGNFSLPPQTDPYVLVALCPEGIAVDDRRKGKAGDLRLKPWATLSGRVTRDGKPMNGALLKLHPSALPLLPDMPMIRSYSTLMSSNDRGFKNDRLTPGRYVVRRRMPTNVLERFWFVDVATIEVKSGESLELNIGDRAHTVIGGLAISMGRPWMVFNAIIEPKAGDSSTRYGVEVAKDGRFRADDVPAGEYVLNVVLHEPPPGQSPGWGAPIAAFTRAFKVEGTRGTLDLGTLTPIENRVRPVEVGQLAPDFNARALDGHDESLSRFKGKFVLLSFWMNSLECHQETTILNGVEERFAGDARLAMISISLDEEPEFATRLARSRKSAWTQCHVRPDAALLAAYGAWSVPRTLLIGPDGRVIATDLRGDQITDAVARALGK